jgi:TM2 domain-containing membrane protein YozV
MSHPEQPWSAGPAQQPGPVNQPAPHAPVPHAPQPYPPVPYAPQPYPPQGQYGSQNQPGPQQQVGPSPSGYGATPYGQVVGVTAKSGGVAVLLSFLWLGAGHLYANEMGWGIGLLLYNAFLVFLSITLIGAIVAVPLWLMTAPFVMYFSAQAVHAFNRRNGLVVH